MAQQEAKTKETDLLAEFEIERFAWADKEAQMTAGFGSIEDMVDGKLLLFLSLNRWPLFRPTAGF